MEVMIHVTSIVLKSWFRDGVIAIVSKDDWHTLGREVLRRGYDLKTEPIRVREPLHELRCAQLFALLSPRLASRAQSKAAFAKSIRREA